AGILAQSVGGGGGAGGNAVANGSGNTFSVNVGLGGNGGSGGTGGTVIANNAGAILTLGGHAPAIHAQSIGGGGGTGGNAAAGGGSSPEVTAGNFVATGMGIPNSVIKKADGIYALKTNIWGDFFDYDSLKGTATTYEAANKTANAAPPKPAEEGGLPDFTLTIGGGRSGNGGSGNHGGGVTVDNSGDLATEGPYSAGILAQSIGAGGGSGGASKPTSTDVNKALDAQLSFTVGGQAGNNGDGGNVTVDNTGTIQTTGDLSVGIHAQSIGGGGGIGAMTVQSGAGNADFSSVKVTLGGSGGASGDGGAVQVNVSPATAQDGIFTTGQDAVGIVAQSIGAGGGATFIMSQDAVQGAPSQSGQTSVSAPVVLGSGGTSATPTRGDGGAVTVSLLGVPSAPEAAGLLTSGVNAHGVLAQSIGGGGGWVVGLNNQGTTSLQSLFGAPGNVRADGGAVNVSLDNNFNLITNGAGAAGVIAQSIGGGGGLFGGLNNPGLNTGAVIPSGTTTRMGQGGPVKVNVTGWSAIATRGDNAPALIAQSLGQGGGILEQAGGQGIVFAGGSAYGGCGQFDQNACTSDVSVNVTTGTVETAGSNSPGIVAQNRGNSPDTSNASVTIGNEGNVTAGGPN
ncbi:hypothetical protein DWF00_07000, partial [Bosea caraganae]